MTSEHKNPEEELSTVKIIGRILEVLALPILIIVAVLQNIDNKNLGIVGLLLGFGSCMFILGLILSHLPRERPQGKIPTIRYCSFCGVRNEEDAIYCKKCGKQIS